MAPFIPDMKPVVKGMTLTVSDHRGIDTNIGDMIVLHLPFAEFDRVSVNGREGAHVTISAKTIYGTLAVRASEGLGIKVLKTVIEGGEDIPTSMRHGAFFKFKFFKYKWFHMFSAPTKKHINEVLTSIEITKKLK